jgi:hypothetical protein
MKRRVLIAAGAALALVAAFVGGRFSAPVRVEERVKVSMQTDTKIEYRDRVVERVVKGPVRVRTITITKPGGERIVERVVERGPVTTERETDLTGQSHGTTASTAATVRTEERGRPGYSVGVSGEWSPGRPSLTPERVGVELDRRLFGTVWLGVRASAGTGFDEPRVGLAARMEF